MKTLVVATAVILLGLYGCNKFLEIEPVMDIEASKAVTCTKDVETLLTGAYDGLQSGNVLGGNMVVFADLLADDAEVNISKLNAFGTLEIYERATTIQLSPLRDMWRDSYATINRANNIIAHVDSGKISDQEFAGKKDNLKGEALFIRAIVHFELVRFWAQPYNVDNMGNNSQLGVPYRKLPVVSASDKSNLYIKRSTVEEVYNNVIEDLKLAESLISGVTSNSRASKMAAKACLARVYFYKGDYANAATKAKEVIASNKYSLNSDLKKVFQTSGESGTSPECIFQMVSITGDQSNSVSGNYGPPSGGSPLFKPDATFRNMFEANDNRKKNYIYIHPITGAALIKKYATANPAHNVVVLRLAEMYLIKGESDALLNSFDPDTIVGYGSLPCYTKIKKRAHGTNTVNLTISWNNYLDSIRIERRREMCYEGDRYHNARRMKIPVRAGVAYNDPSLLFKIPQEEMSGNPLMEQNY